MEKIKLVIWDLDETFWKGTLSEEGIVPNEDNIAIVKELCNRGIMNSIVSKNDFEQAKEKLIELDIWEYFIFPQIAWEAKGLLIKNLIINCQLRDKNVVFIDDNHLNLEEAKYYNPSLNVEGPEFLSEILNHGSFIGKNDSSHSRLKQYKTLEKKHSASSNYSNNLDFLRDSSIKIQRIYGELLLNHIDRIVELIERTNQLNFTKKRSGIDEMTELINNSEYEVALIKVVDKFGDYGYVGFYAINRENNYLEHFVFSCRILNLGVSQYIYASLNFPELKIIPEVAESLDKAITPDWITEVSEIDFTPEFNQISFEDNSKKVKILFKGGCDLGQMLFYLKNRGFSIEEENNYVSENNFPIHREHTQILLDSYYLKEENKKYVTGKEFIPFADQNFYSTKIFDYAYDCVVYSLLMDYTQGIYKHKSKDILLPFGGYSLLWTDEQNDKELLNYYQKRNIDINKETFSYFRNEFSYTGQITPEKFTANLHKIRKLIPEKIPIIFINGVELDSPDNQEKNARERHSIMNNALEKFIENSDNTFVLDVRKVVTEPKQLTNNLRHYNRNSYQKISEELLTILSNVLDDNIKTGLDFRTHLKLMIVKNSLARFAVGLVKKQITWCKNALKPN